LLQKGKLGVGVFFSWEVGIIRRIHAGTPPTVGR
jgi:hypothetical protein